MKLTPGLLLRSFAFRITLALFVVANLWTWIGYRFFRDGCEQLSGVGFPFPLYLADCDTADFYLLGLLLDVTTALTVAVLVTWIVKLIRG